MDEEEIKENAKLPDNMVRVVLPRPRRTPLVWTSVMAVLSFFLIAPIFFFFDVSGAPRDYGLLFNEIEVLASSATKTAETPTVHGAKSLSGKRSEVVDNTRDSKKDVEEAEDLVELEEEDHSSDWIHDEEELPPFLRDHCDLTGVDQWMVPEDDWRRRTPAFLILGEKKSGTTGLFHTLVSHPQVVKGEKKELIFFNPKKFKHWEGGTIGGRVKVAEARKELFSKFDQNLMQQNTSLISGEGTPEYFLYPDVSGKAILCTIPWVKVIVILREPVERLFSHYNFLKDPTKHNRELPKFEKFVMNEIVRMQAAGLLPANLNDIESHMGTQEEMSAYLRYQSDQSLGQGERQFSRSLYALQLEGWARALRRYGKDPKKDMKVVISSEVKNNPNVTNELFEFLGLPKLENHKPKIAMRTAYTSVPIEPKFKAYLNKILAPYNRRLYKFLGKDYEGIFDKN